MNRVLNSKGFAQLGQLLLAGIAFIALLAAPFLLRQPDQTNSTGADRRLVILSPHNERVRNEFGIAFRSYWLSKTGQTVYIDWRTPGGASEISMLVKSEYTAAFEHHWSRVLRKAWSDAVAKSFATVTPSEQSVDDDEGSPRAEFMRSEVGIGVDLMFGGGAYDFQQFAQAGFLVPGSLERGSGLVKLQDMHPQWFSDAVIPAAFEGETFRDAGNRWSGVVLASFGIMFNRDVLRALHIEHEPQDWNDLGMPVYFGRVALSDPTKSGSVAKAFELLIQSQMHKRLAEQGQDPSASAVPPEIIAAGWRQGLQLIQRISANGRYFTDSASKIALEVARGEAAVGMAIDSYGRATSEFLKKKDNASRVGFVMPTGGSSISVDPIGLLRGAPDPELATAFMEFVLSPEGQGLWAFRPGVEGGPKFTPLLRLPIRKDFYTEGNRAHMVYSQAQPYKPGQTFYYRREWTGSALSAIRFIIRVMCVDTHQEQHRAWGAIIAAGMPAAALQVFNNLDRVDYQQALGKISETLRAKDKVREVVLARELGDAFRAQYEKAYALAKRNVASGH